MNSISKNIAIRQATPDRWQDFEQLLGPEKGGSGGCWCMLWRLRKKDYDALSRGERRTAISNRFQRDIPPGLIAYDEERPVGWCSTAPRTEFPRLESSRILKAIDDQPVWSITCFYVAPAYRKQGVSVKLLQNASDLVRHYGGSIIEGYPIEPDRTSYPAVYAWFGLANAFKAAGFSEVARRSPTRPIMRKFLKLPHSFE